MDRTMMKQWLAAQNQKKQVTEASIQRKRLGIKEVVNYGDITTRVTPHGNFPRSPESAANLTRRLQNLAGVVSDPNRTPLEVERAGNSIVAKGVGGGRGPIQATRHTGRVVDDLIHTIRQEKDIRAGKVPDKIRNFADSSQRELSQTARVKRQVAQQAEVDELKNTIKTGRFAPPKPTAVAMAGKNSADESPLREYVNKENWIKQITKTYRNMITEQPDAEGQMAKGELEVMAKKAQELAAMMQDDTQLEAWVQSKITKAKDYISSVHDYMNGNPDKVD